jgi:archaemetzincin
VAGVIYVAYLNGYAPAWADFLTEAIAESFAPEPVRRFEAELDLAPAYASERRQYHATLILAALLRRLPEAGSRMVGITSVDLFIPVLTFVFGQSQLAGAAAVVSTYRLRSQFYGLPPDEGLLLERTIKEAVHELGHAFGLVHCVDQSCVMHASSYVEEVDLKSAEFCAACRAAVCTPAPS